MATHTRDVLAVRLEGLISRSQKSYLTLSGGLKLAYNPNPAANVYRLVLMHPEAFPSDLELEVVRGTLVQVLQKARRPFTDLITEPYLTNHTYKYHVIQWREYRQLSLLTGDSYEHEEQSRHFHP